MTLFTLAKELELRGHSNSVWVHDPGGMMDERAAVARRELVDHFSPLRAGVFGGFEDWHGADVAFATGWQTAYPLWELGDCKLKAYLVQDYEPDFYPASAERMWAEETYRMGYPCIGASPWLRDLMRERYGAASEAFELGVDFGVYRPLELQREEQTVGHLPECVGDAEREIVRLDDARAQNPQERVPRATTNVAKCHGTLRSHPFTLLVSVHGREAGQRPIPWSC